MNQADLAVLCDMSQSQFSKVIRGTRPMTIDQMAVIGDALALDIGKLVAEVEEEIKARDFWTSPVLFVDPLLDERIDPEVRSEDKLADGYARQALVRWREREGRVVKKSNADSRGKRSDYDTAARRREVEPTDEQYEGG